MGGDIIWVGFITGEVLFVGGEIEQLFFLFRKLIGFRRIMGSYNIKERLLLYYSQVFEFDYYFL